MPTGPKHTYSWDELENGEWVRHERECRCMLGDDHHESDNAGYSYDDDMGQMYEDGELME